MQTTLFMPRLNAQASSYDNSKRMFVS